VIAAACLTILAAIVVFRLLASAPPVWDDAYMFYRYAGSLLREGTLAWNPGGPATWGATSLFYVGIVAVSRLLGPDDPLQALLMASLACGALLLFLAARLARGAGVAGMAFALAALAFQARPLSAHFASGMDTMFGAAWLAGYLLLAFRQRERNTTRGAVALGAAGGLSLFARPEMLLFAFCVPMAVAMLGRDQRARRSATLAVAVTGAVLLGALLVAAAGFGAPLPLPFYVKSLGVYGDTMRAAYEGIGVREAVRFSLNNSPLALAALLGAWSWRRSSARPDVAVESGLLLALLAFGTFQTFLVTPIMHYDQRFLYPALPALVALGCRGLEMARTPARPVLAAAALLLVWPVAVLSRQLVADLGADGARPAPLTFEASYRAKADDWFGLERLRRFPDDLVIATTEVGHPGTLFPGKAIVDLAGLNDTMLARGGLRPANLFERRPPDWIYLPHEDYREFGEALESDPFFMAHYDVYRRETLGMAEVEVGSRVESKPYWLSVAIWRNGPHAGALRALVEAERAR
jgi:hypothetical protein